MRVLSLKSWLPGALLAGGIIASDGALADSIYKYRASDGTILFTDQAQGQVGPQYTFLSVRKGWSDIPRVLSNAQRDQYDTLITQAATRFRVEPALVKAVIHAESLFNRNAISRVGAQGLMQLMPETAAYLKVNNPFDPRANIAGGTQFIAYLKGKFSELDHILAAYNAGEGNVRRYGGIPPFKETQAYVKKVKQLRQRYAHQFVAQQGDETVFASR